jgi:putative ABC transport system ATP-binding protein
VNGAEPIVALEEVRFRYPEGEFALSVPALRVDGGERVAIVGPSGSGKTTLLHLVAGIVRPQQGRVSVAGTEVSALEDRARRAFRVGRIGLVFQEFELLEYLTVLENVLLPYRLNPALALDPAARERAEDLARRLGIGHVLGRHPRRLSQGERQRAAVCRALVTGPPLLLADEPTGNLDPPNKDLVLAALFEICREQGATLLTVTHDRDLVPRFDRSIDVKSFHSGVAS